jgi:hypothetical protein
VTRQRTPARDTESAGISPRPGAACTDTPTPPGEWVPSPEGGAPRVSPTPTRGRVIVPLPEAASGLAEAVPRRHGWRVEHINNAPDADTAVRWVSEWARAELAKCRQNRPEDADAFAWQIVHAVAAITGVIYKGHPRSEFRDCPRLPGGGWTPRRPKTRTAEARHP